MCHEKALGKLVAPQTTKQGKIRSNTKEWSMQKQKMIIEVKNVREEGDDEFPSLATTKKYNISFLL